MIVGWYRLIIGFGSTAGPGSMLHLFVAAGIGWVSGQYIFKQPLEEYWAEQRALEAEKNASSSVPSDDKAWDSIPS